MSDDDELRALIALAKKMPHSESARRDAVSFAGFEASLAQRGQRVRRRAVYVASAVVTCGTLLLAWPGLFEIAGSPQTTPLSYRVEQAVSAREAANAPIREELAFSDGSRVKLARHAEASVAKVTAHGARVVLGNGRAEVSIAKRKNAAWQLVAGPYTVRVTGTAFRLVWSRERQELEVGMHHGSVVVTGPMAEQGVTLAAGQRLVGSPRARRLVVEPWSGQEGTAVASAGLSADQGARAAQQLNSASSEIEARASRAQKKDARTRLPGGRERLEHGWAKLVAQGQFAAVLHEARGLGLSRALEASTASDLAALADAARYARQEALGQRSLLALRERFPNSELAQDSAFLLGRLSKNRQALVWYERYLGEQPNGSYVSQALGRSMMLCYELGEAERAHHLAASYLQRFPSGPYAASARKITASGAGERRNEAPGSAREQHHEAPQLLPGQLDKRVESPAP